MNELVNNKVRAELLADLISKRKCGDIILHSEIVKVIECEYNTNAYRTAIAKAKKILLDEHSIAIQSIAGQGYKIVDPDKFTDYALGYYKRGMNSMKRGRKCLDNAPVKAMSPDSLQTYRLVHDRAVRLDAAMAGVAVELKTLARKPHPFAVEAKD